MKLSSSNFVFDEICEFEYLYRSVFSGSCDQDVLERCGEANKLLLESGNSAMLPTLKVDVSLIVSKKLDVEAIEYYLRRSRGLNTLSQKLHILMYVTESNVKYYDTFINESESFLKAVVLLSIYSFRSLYKLAKGFYLTRRFRIV